MSAIKFDTLRFVKQLKAVGIEQDHAEAIPEGNRDVQETSLDNLVTKQDLSQAIEKLSSEMKQGFLRVDSNFTLLRWMFGVALAGIIALVLDAFFLR